ncbi:peptide chain release factor N(5)-glutamine methyltransferase [Carnobacteriaceae bacterium zg-ZUI240]|nr:peptide chain release factor N(5)-glutamine methyltransferase [Carnobacteriaceae bacterium zg-ZUI240]
MANNNRYIDVLQSAQQMYANIRSDLFERLLCDRLGWNKTDFILHAHEVATPEHQKQFEKDVERLVLGEPLQYIVGCEWFYGRCFTVNPQVLIPRPETELLVEEVLHISRRKQRPLNIVDIGTGSGAIGVTLALESKKDNVTITDISKTALQVAKRNAQQLGASVRCVESDVFDGVDKHSGTFDIIVSNPPYISESEQHLMDESVLMHEPHLALFAKDNGLAIYEKILHQANDYLSKDGIIVLEIGFSQANDIRRLSQFYFPKKSVRVIKDYAQLDRIVIIE